MDRWIKCGTLTVQQKPLLYLLLLGGLSAVYVLISSYPDPMNPAFYRRFVAWASLDDRPTLSVTFIGPLSAQTDSVQSDLIFHLKSSRESSSNYHATLSMFRNSSVLRIRVDEMNPDPVRPRYIIPDGDVVVSPPGDPGEPLSTLSVSSRNGQTVIEVSGRYRVEMHHEPFLIQVYRGQTLLQVINGANLFAFEKYRSKNGDSCPFNTELDMACNDGKSPPESWEEPRAGGFSDVKKWGPSAVGLDVHFESAKAVFGLPEHPLPFKLPLNSGPFRFFNVDSPAYKPGSHDALYGAIAMLTAIHQGSDNESGFFSGFFWINPSETFVNLVTTDGGGIDAQWVSETGVMDMFVFTGPSPQEVIKQYHYVTGKAPMAPMFALGYQQSHWGWSQKEVMEVNKKFIDTDIPCDVIWLDIQYTDRKRYFTWDKDVYPDPDKLISAVTQAGRKIVTIVDPHIAIDDSYYVYKEGKERRVFVRGSQGDSDFQGKCWPDGMSSYVDFTRRQVRDWWGSLFAYSKFKHSTPDVFIWNDMNEPSVFDSPDKSVPRSMIHRLSSGSIVRHEHREVHGLNEDNNRSATSNGFLARDTPARRPFVGYEHREVHGLYGHYNRMATFNGLLARDTPARRPFVLSRSFFAGSHRHGPHWTGDNVTSWQHLKLSLAMVLSLSVSGYSFVGADVGGFMGETGEPELFVRWHQLASIIYPFYRGHSIIDLPDREPWSFDVATQARVKAAVDLRYALLPYWYTSFSQHALEGLPIIRPLWFNFPSDTQTYMDPLMTEEECMLGDSLLVRGIFAADADSTRVYFPGTARTTWFDFHEPTKRYGGGSATDVVVSSDHVPLFVKGGSIVPMKLTKRQSTKFMKNDRISLKVFLNVNIQATGLLYLDDEQSMMYDSDSDFCLVRIDFGNGGVSYKVIAGRRAFDSTIIGHIDIYEDSNA